MGHREFVIAAGWLEIIFSFSSKASVFHALPYEIPGADPLEQVQPTNSVKGAMEGSGLVPRDVVSVFK